MSYKEFDVNSQNVKYFLEDIIKRKEFNNYNPAIREQFTKHIFGYSETLSKLVYPSIYPFFSAQYFIRNFINPNTPYKRLLLKWQVGTGKTKGIGAIAHEFIKQYKQRTNLGEHTPQVFVIAFTQEIIQNELIKDPYFGFANVPEIIEWNALKIAASKAGSGSEEMQKFSSFLGILRRRITDRARGGYYTFYGYKAFANRLFIITTEGEKAKFNVLEYTANKTITGDNLSYTDAINEAVKRGYITINNELLNSMKNSLLICDEIHDVYNIAEVNNYGIAIQYVLDTLDEEAPRCIFMSATPITGAASEIVDVLNLLVPKADMRKLVPKGYLLRSDLFTKCTSRETEDDEYFTVSSLKPGALDMIRQLSVGRVSFLLDADVAAYPKRVIIGEDVKSVPYLKLNLCPMSDFQELAFLEERKAFTDTPKPDTAGFNLNSYCMNDLVFPGPDGKFLYNSTEIVPVLQKQHVESAIVEKIAPYGNIITGSFLHKSNLPKYSSKYTYMLNLIEKIVKTDVGKILIYHNRVKVSGVLIIQEILKMNGIIDEFMSPNDNTLCNVCGVKFSDHPVVKANCYSTFSEQLAIYTKKTTPHPFVPTRFLIVNSDIDKNTFERRKALFNADTNTLGHNYRIFLGSKIIKQSHEFVSTRHEIITSFPINYPVTIQVMGRIIRRKAHALLPPELRQGNIYFLVTVRKSGAISPELKKYIDKGQEYLVIQEVDRVMSEVAIDAFMNYEKIKYVQQTDGYINILPYTPVEIKQMPLSTITFNAYNHSDMEIEILQNMCKVLFMARGIWAYADLVKAIKSKVIENINYNSFDDKNIAIAFNKLKTPHKTPNGLMKITYIGGNDQYYIYVKVLNDYMTNLDLECYMKPRKESAGVTVNLTQYLHSGINERNFKLRLQDFNKILLSLTPELILTEFIDTFHYMLLKKIITGSNVTANDKLATSIYKKFKLLYHNAYVTKTSVMVYKDNTWTNMMHSDFDIGPRHKENNIIVGIVNNDATASILDTPQFKIRTPGDTVEILDNRKLSRGLACQSYPKQDLLEYIDRFKRILTKYDIKMPESDSTVGGICQVIKLILLKLEQHSRAESMIDSTRYLYLF